MTYKLFIFDMDDTLIHEGFEDDSPILCDDTIKCFELLKKKNALITVATFNENGKTILKNAGLDSYICQIEDFDFHDKFTHVTNILKNYPDINMEEIVYIDDDKINNKKIQSSFGIKCVQVNYEVGIILFQIEELMR